MRKVCKQIAKKYSIKVRFDCPDINQSFCIGNDEILIGQYKEAELAFISFFHELGHCLIEYEYKKSWNYNTLVIEIECWNIGLREAKKHNILFSDNAIKWGYKQALSYVGHDERESDSWEEKIKPKLWKHKIGIDPPNGKDVPVITGWKKGKQVFTKYGESPLQTIFPDIAKYNELESLNKIDLRRIYE